MYHHLPLGHGIYSSVTNRTSTLKPSSKAVNLRCQWTSHSELLNNIKEATYMRHLQTHMQSKAGSYHIICECFKTIYSKKQFWKVTAYIFLVAAYPAI